MGWRLRCCLHSAIGFGVLHGEPRRGRPAESKGAGGGQATQELRDTGSGLCARKPRHRISSFDDSAKLIPGGGNLRIEVHYTPNGKAVSDQTRIGFVLAKEASPASIRHTRAEISRKRAEAHSSGSRELGNAWGIGIRPGRSAGVAHAAYASARQRYDLQSDLSERHNRNSAHAQISTSTGSLATNWKRRSASAKARDWWSSRIMIIP